MRKSYLIEFFKILPDLLFGNHFNPLYTLQFLPNFCGSLFKVDVLKPDKLNGHWIFFRKTSEIICRNIEFFFCENFLPDQFQKTTCGCLNIGSGVVSFSKRFREKDLV